MIGDYLWTVSDEGRGEWTGRTRLASLLHRSTTYALAPAKTLDSLRDRAVPCVMVIRPAQGREMHARHQISCDCQHDPLADIVGLLDGIALKAGLDRTRALRMGASMGLRLEKPLTQSWPRPFSATAEILAIGWDDVAEIADILLESREEPHLVYLFGEDVHSCAAEAEARGYDACWTVELLGISLHDEPEEPQTPFAVERVTARSQVEELNALDPDYPSRLDALVVPRLFDVLARYDGSAAGKGQLVIGKGDVSSIADMFTAGEYRRKGCGRQILAALQTEARERGAHRAVLLPSRMAVEVKFYQACGYSAVTRAAVLISKEQRHNG
jgi:GNAT superfamily N-acetyltransferase